MKNIILFLTTGLLISAFAVSYGNAETIVTETTTQTKVLPNVKQIQFADFDINKDGAYSMPEVGEVLFKLFDTDGNQLIDNNEWTNNNVMTIVPIEKTQFKYVDINDDGFADKITRTYDEFFVSSGLMAFDKNMNGLSAKEFIGKGYNDLDTNHNEMISLDEWKESYLKTRPKHNKPENYNGGRQDK